MEYDETSSGSLPPEISSTFQLVDSNGISALGSKIILQNGVAHSIRLALPSVVGTGASINAIVYGENPSGASVGSIDIREARVDEVGPAFNPVEGIAKAVVTKETNPIRESIRNLTENVTTNKGDIKTNTGEISTLKDDVDAAEEKIAELEARPLPVAPSPAVAAFHSNLETIRIAGQRHLGDGALYAADITITDDPAASANSAITSAITFLSNDSTQNIVYNSGLRAYTGFGNNPLPFIVGMDVARNRGSTMIQWRVGSASPIPFVGIEGGNYVFYNPSTGASNTITLEVLMFLTSLEIIFQLKLCW